jgi:hypothetical protein
MGIYMVSQNDTPLYIVTVKSAYSFARRKAENEQLPRSKYDHLKVFLKNTDIDTHICKSIQLYKHTHVLPIP